jgi:hypothetical protein
MFAVVGDADSSDGGLIDEAEESAVGAGVGAEALAAEDVDDEKSADGEGEQCDADAGKGLPKCGSHEVIGERRGGRADEPAIGGRPDEHVDREGEGGEDEDSRTERFYLDADFFEEPGAEVLVGDEVASPAAEESA